MNNDQKFCEPCGRKFGSACVYQAHLNKVHKVEIPKDPSNQQPELTPDIPDSDSYCKKCERKYLTHKHYQHHLLRMHTKKRLPTSRSVLHPEIQPDLDSSDFYCAACEKQLSSKITYQFHLQRIHKVKQQHVHRAIKNKGALPDYNDPNYFCCACKSYLKSGVNFFRHVRKKHKMEFDDPSILPDVADPNLHCAPCNKTFKWKRNFYSHLRTIHTLDPYVKRRTTLVTNIKVDINDPNLYCRACERKFTNKRNYQHHLRAIHKKAMNSIQPNVNNLPNQAVVVIKDKSIKSKSSTETQSLVSGGGKPAVKKDNTSVKEDGSESQAITVIKNKAAKRKVRFSKDTQTVFFNLRNATDEVSGRRAKVDEPINQEMDLKPVEVEEVDKIKKPTSCAVKKREQERQLTDDESIGITTRVKRKVKSSISSDNENIGSSLLSIKGENNTIVPAVPSLLQTASTAAPSGFKCHVCNKEFKWQRVYDSHMEVMHSSA